MPDATVADAPTNRVRLIGAMQVYVELIQIDRRYAQWIFVRLIVWCHRFVFDRFGWNPLRIHFLVNDRISPWRRRFVGISDRVGHREHAHYAIVLFLQNVGAVAAFVDDKNGGIILAKAVSR